MNKFLINLKSHYLAYIITFFIGGIIGTTITLLMYFLKNRILYDAINGATISMGVLIGFGILMWVGDNGLFDGLSYGAKQIFTSAFSKKANKMNDYATYVQNKNLRRKAKANIYWSLVASGIVFAIVLIVLEIIYHS